MGGGGLRIQLGMIETYGGRPNYVVGVTYLCSKGGFRLLTYIIGMNWN
jgi:hypothetical protein